MKINFDVAIRQSGSYITVSCRDSSSFLYTVYTERIRAMDPLLGETMAIVHAIEIALLKNWPCVIFETDSKLLFQDITNLLMPPCWKIEDLVHSIRKEFKAQATWSIHWVPRRLNQQAHILAEWAARSSFTGFLDVNRIPLLILNCDGNSVLSSFQ